MKRAIVVSVAVIGLFAGIAAAKDTASERKVYDIRSGETKTLGRILPDLLQRTVILVGEHHTDEIHHLNQLQVCQALAGAGARIAIGLEMFRNDSQEVLDRWVAGRIPEEEFVSVYYDNWNFPWPLYRPIFLFARDQGIPMIGLNVSREITAQVARKGFSSLSAEQKETLGEITCNVDRVYMDFIRRAFGGHGHGKLNFTYFCEAQLVWDNVMAVHALAFLKSQPDRKIVLLAGTGHVRRAGIPDQIRKRRDVPMAIVLPEVEDVIAPKAVSESDGDYILMAP